MTMIKILILIFESSFGCNTLYISQDFALYTLAIEESTNETLFDFRTQKRYVKLNNKFEEYFVPDINDAKILNEKSKRIVFHGYQSLEFTDSLVNYHYTGKFRQIFSEIPLIEEFLPSNSDQFFLPIAKKDQSSRILFRTYFAESHDGKFEEHTIIFDDLKSIEISEVEPDFFSKHLNSKK